MAFRGPLEAAEERIRRLEEELARLREGPGSEGALTARLAELYEALSKEQIARQDAEARLAIERLERQRVEATAAAELEAARSVHEATLSTLEAQRAAERQTHQALVAAYEERIASLEKRLGAREG